MLLYKFVQLLHSCKHFSVICNAERLEIQKIQQMAEEYQKDSVAKTAELSALRRTEQRYKREIEE